MTNNRNRICVSNRERMLLVCAILMVIPLLCISVYNRPSADDYDYALLTHEAVQKGKGIFSILRAALRTDVRFYFNWQGLYTSAFLLSLQPAIFGEEFYFLAAPIIFLVSYLFLWGAVHIVLKRLLNVTKGFSAIWAFWGTAFLFASMPGLTEGLYWYNGAMNYTPWAFADCLIIALIFDAHYLQGKRRIAVVICASVLAFIVSGGNHVTAFEDILLLFTASAVLLICERKKYPLIPLSCALIGFLIMYMAPGTAARQDHLSRSTVLPTIIASLLHTLEQVNDWCNLGWLLLLLSVTPLLLDIIQKHPSRFHRFPIIELLLSFGLLCAMNCVPYYAMSNFGEPRLTNVTWIAFLMCSILNYTFLIGYLYTSGTVDISKVRNAFARNRWTQPLFLLICFTIIFSTSNCLTVSKELVTGKASSYAAEMDQRIAQFNGPEDTILLSPIQNSDSILFFTDLNSDPDVWPNYSVGAYYGGKTIARYDD